MDQTRRIIDKSSLHFALWHGDLISFAILMINTICYSRISPDTILINCEGSWSDQINWVAQCSPHLHKKSSFSFCVSFLLISDTISGCVYSRLHRNTLLCVIPETRAEFKAHIRWLHPAPPLRTHFTLTNTDGHNCEALDIRLKHSEKTSPRRLIIFSTSTCQAEVSGYFRMRGNWRLKRKLRKKGEEEGRRKGRTGKERGRQKRKEFRSVHMYGSYFRNDCGPWHPRPC